MSCRLLIRIKDVRSLLRLGQRSLLSLLILLLLLLVKKYREGLNNKTKLHVTRGLPKIKLQLLLIWVQRGLIVIQPWGLPMRVVQCQMAVKVEFLHSKGRTRLPTRVLHQLKGCWTKPEGRGERSLNKMQPGKYELVYFSCHLTSLN